MSQKNNQQQVGGENSSNLDKSNKRSVQYLIKPQQRDLEQDEQEIDRDDTEYKINLRQGSCFNLSEFKSENELQKNINKDESDFDQFVTRKEYPRRDQKFNSDINPQPYEVKVISPHGASQTKNNINSPSLLPYPSSFISMQNPQTISSMNNQELETSKQFTAKQGSSSTEKKGDEPIFLQFFKKYKERSMTQKIVMAMKESNKTQQQEEKKITELKKKTHNFWSKLKSYVYIQSLLKLVQNEKSNKEVSYEENYFKMVNDMASAVNQESIKEHQFFEFHNNPLPFDKDKNHSFSVLSNRKKFRVLEPHEIMSILIDLWMQILIILVLFQYSVELFFSFEHNEEVYSISKKATTYISMASFLMDIVRNFNTGYYYKGIVIMDRIKIAKRYAGKLLFFDIISLVSQLIVTFLGKFILQWHWVIFYSIKLLVFFRISGFINSQRRLSNFLNTKQKLHEWISVFKLFAYLLLLAHIVAIMFHGLAQYEIIYLNYDDTWLHEAHIEKDGWIIRYLNSIFWATGSMVTVILYNPKTLEETIFINIILLINCLVFGYTINTLGDILKDLNKDKKDLNQEINIINRYLNLRQVSSNLKIKIRNYLEYMNKNVLTKNQEEESLVISKLSHALQDELKREINFKRIKLFTPILKNFSQSVLYNLLIKIQEINITPNEQIIRTGTPDDCSIYVVSSGEVQISLRRDDDFDEGSNEEQMVKILKKGDIFGEVSFFTGEVRRASARSVDFGQLYKISRQDFISLLKGRGLDEEKFAFIKDSVLFYKQYEKIQLKCFVCQSQNHLSSDCNKIHLSLVKRKVLNPSLKNQDQLRGRDYKREDRKHRMSSINTLQLQKDCWIALEQFIQHNYEEIDQYEVEYQINDYSLTLDEEDDLHPHHNIMNNNDLSGEEESFRSPSHQQQQYPLNIINYQGRGSGTGQQQSPPYLHNRDQQGLTQMNQFPLISQWLPNSMQQAAEGKNFHDYIEIFNKEMRIQQKTTTNSNLRKQTSKQMANILKEMNKQRQGSNGFSKKPIVGSSGEEMPSFQQGSVQQKSSERTGEFLHPQDSKDVVKEGSKNELSQPSQNELTSNQLSESDDERNITDEIKNIKSSADKQKISNKSEEQSAVNNEHNDNLDEDNLCSFREQQIDEQVYERKEKSKQLPLFKSNINLQEYNQRNNQIKNNNSNKNLDSPKFQIIQFPQQQEQESPLIQKKSQSHSPLKNYPTQRAIHSDEKYRKTSFSYINQDAQVSIDCSSPSQATSYSIGSNLRGLSHKKIPGGGIIDERRISNISSINAKRVSRDSIFFKQHNIPHILNSPYRHSPKSSGLFNLNVSQSPYLEQNQLSAIIEDLDLLDEKVDSQKQHPSLFSAFLKKPNSNNSNIGTNSPQFFQHLQYPNQGFIQNPYSTKHQHNLAPNLVRNYPSFSSNNISQGNINVGIDHGSPHLIALSPKRERGMSGSRNLRAVAAENRRKSMFATLYSSPDQQTRQNQQLMKNTPPQIIPALYNQSSDSTTQQQQTNTNSSFINTSKQITKRRKQSVRVVNDSQVNYPNTHSKRQSILKNPSKFGLLGQPQQQFLQQNNLNINTNNHQLQMLSPQILSTINQGIGVIPTNHSVLYRQSQMGQQLNIHALKLDQYMEQNQQPFIFDAMKLFKIYFILGNYDVVIDKLQQRRKKSFKKPQATGQLRRLITRSQKDKAFTQFQSLKMHKNMLSIINPPQFLNTDNSRNNIFSSQNQRKETMSSNRTGEAPQLIFKKIQSEVVQ